MANDSLIKNKFGLILLAGIVWFCAGFNVLRIGIAAYRDLAEIRWWIIVLSLVIMVLFGVMFMKMVKKNTRRILRYETKQKWWHFFNLKSYLIMAFFMTFGISLRVSGVAPDLFIAFFYAGLGTALSSAGLAYGVNSVRVARNRYKIS